MKNAENKLLLISNGLGVRVFTSPSGFSKVTIRDGFPITVTKEDWERIYLNPQNLHQIEGAIESKKLEVLQVKGNTWVPFEGFLVKTQSAGESKPLTKKTSVTRKKVEPLEADDG